MSGISNLYCAIFNICYIFLYRQYFLINIFTNICIYIWPPILNCVLIFGDTSGESFPLQTGKIFQENPGRGFNFELRDDQETVVVEAVVDVKNPRTSHNELILFNPAQA